MNVSPISFGKIVQIRGSRSVAGTIMNYANTPNARNLDKNFKRDVNKVFNDVKKGSAEVWEQPDGSTYIFSGEDTLQLSKYLKEREEAVADVWWNYKDEELQSIMTQVKAEVCIDKIEDLIDKKLEPYALTTFYSPKGGMHLFKIM